ncbi:ribosomal RNA small subunit methyltransferase B, putative [Pseudooceanicola batsensis HTCC2597]|uniref:Ribosomal RNA small subunit methyltransferase B, putative n=1 Tax=Pseudooceanicola batsensis (strain ATCC BAA-863 / DSM 15984 / KCTC 12145 / HTCC2597) TaxID=252305 RepID=A3TW12_PSEBH|nr:transcription antitermination factor NusB [Pseudooceanicola batsensis]EAQ03808.1 ribosomal RNA small subunit methyltransferase B, putative [Pseudooceanicola batsensis HTCC2597]
MTPPSGKRPHRGGRPGRSGPARPAGTNQPDRSNRQAKPRPERRPDPRRAAHQLVSSVIDEQKTLADLLGRTGPLGRFDPADRARAQRLATETLRHLGRLDTLLAEHLSHMPPLPVLITLRIATYELATSEAAHGVVNSAVTHVAAMPRHNRLKGMTNAVLRKVAATAPSRWPDLPPSPLPDWLRAPLVMAWGEAGVVAMEAAHARGAPLDLTPRDPSAAADMAQRLEARVLPTGNLRIDRPVQVSRLEGFDAGEWWVQDAAAAIPARLLGARPGEKVLDMCAAPGGKTLQLAAAGAEVTALDISAARTERITENLARTGLGAEIVVADALDFDRTGWDAILLDAPCSATGTIRRHPDLPHAQDGSRIGDLIALQSGLIDHALSLLRPGGRLVFCTCSLIPDEGEVQVAEALARHPGLSTDPADLDLPGLEADWITQEGGLRLRPDHWAGLGGMDGFYIAMLRKPA